MAIKLNPAPTFWRDIQLTVPGQAEPAVVPMELAYKTAEQFSEFWKANESKPVAEVLRAVVRNWDGQAVLADDGTPTPFSDQALAKLLSNYQASASEIWRQYQLGLTESRAKN